MDLMNEGLLALSKDLALRPATVFRQEANLVAGIDKLFCGNKQESNRLIDGRVQLPERKLSFGEVQNILNQASKTIVTQKPPDVLLKQVNDIRKMLIKKIEAVLNDINKKAETGETPKLVIRNQRLWSNCIYDLDRVTLKAFNDAKKTILTYSSNEDKTRFNRIVFVLAKVHELLSKNMTVTRRELFYQNVIRLRSQTNLDVAVRDVCCLLETPPWTLGVVATAKGLIAGPLTMHNRNGTVIDCMSSGGTLIPQDVEGIKDFVSSAKYILVVEKDAIFQKLLDEGALVRLGPVIIMTGKGYPDVCTRQLLCRLCKELRLRALALVDADPHGLEIFLTYKYGSLAQSHLSSSLACSSLWLLGARLHDILTLAPNEVRLQLTALDKRKLAALIRRPYLNNSTEITCTKADLSLLEISSSHRLSLEALMNNFIKGLKIKEELGAMLSSGVKAEIEALAPTAAALCDAYLPSKLIQADYLDDEMDNNKLSTNEKIVVNKTKSYNDSRSIPIKSQTETVKRKSFNVNNAVQSQDLTLRRLKKSKLVNGEYPCSSHPSRAEQMFDDSPNYSCNQSTDNVSLMSMNFSYYELVRNLSCTRTNCNSDGAHSSNTSNHTSNTCPSPTDMKVKDENLEKYFQSAEMWDNKL